MIHLEVAVAAPLPHTLTYALASAGEEGEDAEGELIGRRVLVPLAGRRVTGYILAAGVAERETGYRIRPIGSFADEYPLFHPVMVPFFRWVAEYYHHPLGLVIKAALPAGLAPKTVSQLVLRPEVDRTALLGAIAPLPTWLATLARDGSLSPAESARLATDRDGRKLRNRLLRENILAWRQLLQKDGVSEKHLLCYAFTAAVPRPPSGAADRRLLGEYRRQLEEETGTACTLAEARTLHALASFGDPPSEAGIPQQEIRQVYRGAAAALAGLAAKGLVRMRRHRLLRAPGYGGTCSPRPERLTPRQTAVVSELAAAIAGNLFTPFLLHGVTGSGKTEIYLRAAEMTLAAGRDVLILVPEIALASQLENEFLARFPEQVVSLHSGLAPAERFDQYYLALSGRARVVIGARSAVFAPLRKVGLIIVDEEHDGGYKQDDSFAYHGRDLAVLRGQQQGAVVLLGSATPSVTSYAHALSGKYRLLELPERIGERALPQVTVVRLGAEEGHDKGRIIGPLLTNRLTETLARGKQAILLLNRRGFSAVLLCQACGSAVQCDHCHVSLTLHKGKERLLCHYCGFQRDARTVCSSCRGKTLVPVGFGTERVEEEVRQLLPQARLQRLDSDTAADRKKLQAVLTAMHRGAVDILIGTQMIAKGHHFPEVTLVGVVWADGGMNMPDFRAAERTFQLITQVTGRAGRGESLGEVVIQTLRPEHYAIEYARRHQYLALYQHEMRLRRHPAFPPYVRLTALRLEARSEKEARQSAGRVAVFCRSQSAAEGGAVEVLGPAPAPLDKIKDRYRWQILLKSQSSPALARLCAALRQQPGVTDPGCRLQIDVDPENML
jgi:primosomal protein N' (replication factor Y) (superfamily II helicase)